MTVITRIRFTLIAMLFASVGLLTACGGGGGGGTTTTPAVTVDPVATAARGFYQGNGTIQGGSGDITIASPNIKGIVDEKGFVFTYKGNDENGNAIVLFYKGTFTEVTATSFKAEVRVYVDGVYQETATISDGVIDAGVSFSGTLVGGGNYASSNGAISLSYALDNQTAPPTYLTTSSNKWSDIVGTTGTGQIIFNSTTNFDAIIALDGVPNNLDACDLLKVNTTNVANEQTGRIRKFSADTTGCAGQSNDGQSVTGYFTNFETTNPDDRLYIVVSNDNYAYTGILSCAAASGNCLQ